MNKTWAEEDESEGEESPSEKKPKKTKAKDTKRPTAQKFSEIMKSQDAFPTLENQEIYDDDDSDN